MAFDLQAAPFLRALAWAALVALGLWVWAKRPDAAGRAFAYWAFVWGGGVQLTLAVQAMATDAPTQQLLYRVAYYAILASTPAFIALLLFAPRRAARATPVVGVLLGLTVLAALAFALDHGAFLAEAVTDGAYTPTNAGPMAFGFPVLVWSGFLAGMLWLAWRAPSWPARERTAATWLMAGLALFAADRCVRTFAMAVRDPATLGAPPEGWVYGLFMAAFGVAALLMVLRTRALPDGANVGLAALLGGALGATAMVTYGIGGGTTIPVVVSAMLGPLYGALMAEGVRCAPEAAPASASEPAPVAAAGVRT